MSQYLTQWHAKGFQKKLVFLQRHPHCLGVNLIALLTPVYCARAYGFETVLVTLMSVMAALSPCRRSRHLAVSIVTLLSASSPCCRLSHSLAVGLIALQSVSSPCCQPPCLAAGALEICLTAFQCHHFTISIITLQLLILSLIMRHRTRVREFTTLSTMGDMGLTHHHFQFYRHKRTEWACHLTKFIT